jgi:hypothetical protein
MKFITDNKGQVLPLFAFVLLFAIPLLALVVDVGNYQNDKSKLDNVLYTTTYVVAKTYAETDDMDLAVSKVIETLQLNNIDDAPAMSELSDNSQYQIIVNGVTDNGTLMITRSDSVIRLDYSGVVETIFASSINVDTIDLNISFEATIVEPTSGDPLISVEKGLLPFSYLLPDIPENLTGTPGGDNEFINESCALTGYENNANYNSSCDYEFPYIEGSPVNYFSGFLDSPFAKDLATLGLTFESINKGPGNGALKLEVIIEEEEISAEDLAQLELLVNVMYSQYNQQEGPNIVQVPTKIDFYSLVTKGNSSKYEKIGTINNVDDTLDLTTIVGSDGVDLIFNHPDEPALNYVLDETPNTTEDLYNSLIPIEYDLESTFTSTLYNGTRLEKSIYDEFNANYTVINLSSSEKIKAAEYFNSLIQACPLASSATSCSKRIINLPVVIPGNVNGEVIEDVRIIGFTAFFVESVTINGDNELVDVNLVYTADISIGVSLPPNSIDPEYPLSQYPFGLNEKVFVKPSEGAIIDNIQIIRK